MTDPNDRRDDDRPRDLSSPYGPQPDAIDEASGGADSSLYEELPSDERRAAAEKARRDKGPRPE